MANALKINVSTVWKTVDVPWINVGGTWKTPDKVSINVGGVWKEVWVGGPSVSCAQDGRSNYRFGNTCYTGARFYASGVEYEVTSTNGSASKGNWLDSGSSSEVWVRYTKTAGSDFSGRTSGTRYNLASNYTFSRSVYNGYTSTTCSWQFYDAASGGNLLDSTGTFLYAADSDVEQCPLCCFTPDTLVSMVSGINIPISDVREGDKIMGMEGPETVHKVIVRQDIPIFKLRFADGRTINTSPDHPFHTEDGPRSLNEVDYKKIGEPAKLRVGDRVFTSEGNWLRLEAIEYTGREPIVYTFSNSLFYANGLLVY